MELYFTLFNIFQSIFALAAAVGAGYLFYVDGTLIAKIGLGIAGFYLLTAFMGLAGRMYKCGHNLWLLLLVLLLVVQAVFLVGLVFFKDDVLGWVKDVDAEGVTQTVDKAWDYVNDNILIAQIILGVDVGAIVLALLLGVFTSSSRHRDVDDSPV